MRVTILVDNLAARGLEAEWGLSIYVEYQGHAILLDTGASDRFARNADTLGIDLSTVSFGVLSHAHWDHGNGMGTFFARNPTAPFYLRQGCGETCYDKTPEGWRYEGLQRGLLSPPRRHPPAPQDAGPGAAGPGRQHVPKGGGPVASR